MRPQTRLCESEQHFSTATQHMLMSVVTHIADTHAPSGKPKGENVFGLTGVEKRSNCSITEGCVKPAECLVGSDGDLFPYQQTVRAWRCSDKISQYGSFECLSPRRGSSQPLELLITRFFPPFIPL